MKFIFSIVLGVLCCVQEVQAQIYFEIPHPSHWLDIVIPKESCYDERNAGENDYTYPDTMYIPVTQYPDSRLGVDMTIGSIGMKIEFITTCDMSFLLVSPNNKFYRIPGRNYLTGDITDTSRAKSLVFADTAKTHSAYAKFQQYGYFNTYSSPNYGTTQNLYDSSAVNGIWKLVICNWKGHGYVGNCKLRRFDLDFMSKVTEPGDEDSTATSLGNMSSLQTILYPNPAQTTLQVYSNSNDLMGIRVFTMQGVQVYSGEIFDKASIDISQLPIGTYMVQIQTDEGVHTQKLVIQR